MEKTFYEILEVSENASAEIIEKAYKVLVKKYHPDLQQTVSENKIKQINDAYEVLSDDVKRRKYDEELSRKRQYEKQVQEARRLRQNAVNNTNNRTQVKTKTINKEEVLKSKIKKIAGILAFILLLVLLGLILWLIPPTRNILINIYENNDIIKSIVDIIGAIITGTIDGIINVFRN